MNWDDDFDRELIRYSEMETVPEDHLPRTISEYRKKILSNNNSSIFDADYTLDEASKNSESCQEGSKQFNAGLEVFKDEKVTYIISGRGRGGRNMLINPGQLNRDQVLNGDDEIRQQIRKVAPIGYSNEITETAVRAHKMAKILEKDPNANVSPTVLKLNSKPSSPVVSEASSVSNSLSPAGFKTKSNGNVESPFLSGKSTPSSANDVQSSDYYTSQDHNVSSSSSQNMENEEQIEQSKNDSLEASAASISNTLQSSGVNTGAIPKKVVPLSAILRQSREAHKRKQLERDLGLNSGLGNEYTKGNHENDLASQRTIEHILRQDRLEQQLRKNQQLSDRSSSSSVSSREESWRRKNNSPLRYVWGRDEGRGSLRTSPKQLDINSFEDFPTLK